VRSWENHKKESKGSQGKEKPDLKKNNPPDFLKSKFLVFTLKKHVFVL